MSAEMKEIKEMLMQQKATMNASKVDVPVLEQHRVVQLNNEPQTVNVQNRFDGLEIQETVNTDITMGEDDEQDDTPFEMEKNIRPPPIHIHQQQINDTIKLIKGLKIEDFHIKRINNNKHTLQTTTMESYKQAKEVLNEVNTPYFTYTPKDEKPKTIVLKGLHENEDMDDIKLLIQQHDITVMNITQLKTKQSTNMERKLPLYIVQCAPDTNMGKIYNIKTLNYQTVSWETLKKRDAIMQCHQCQRFGHAAANCHLQYRCVKCDQQHEPGQCTINDKINKEDIYCTNCNEKGHPASYKGCPIYQATLARLKERINEKRTSKPAIIPITKTTYVNTANGTFADMLKGGGKQTTTTTTNPLRDRTTTTTTTLNDNAIIIQQLTNKIDKVAETVAQQGEQISTLLALIQQLVK